MRYAALALKFIVYFLRNMVYDPDSQKPSLGRTAFWIYFAFSLRNFQGLTVYNLYPLAFLLTYNLGSKVFPWYFGTGPAVPTSTPTTTGEES